ncbi:MAG: lycopene cyclase domain-containing protein [Actinomycetota bacterium]|nr:lycopene cyclase domain-containing protein [Actinomycetota bacterium]
MAGCVVATAPLEIVLGAHVWRRPRRLLRTLIGPVVVFSVWDVAAIAHHHWSYSDRYTTGWDLPGGLPVEEVTFFVVIPICALLTYEVVNRILEAWRARRRPGSSGAPTSLPGVAAPGVDH